LTYEAEPFSKIEIIGDNERFGQKF
jgi:hypothetical protein